jgi:hypothetical protein
VSQHAGLTEERWARFDLDQQVLMIANEMNRNGRLLDAEGSGPRLRGYERILRLTDLTVAVQSRAALRRELLRWRDLIAALYIAEAPEPEAHRAAFRVLLQLRPLAAKQIPALLP